MRIFWDPERDDYRLEIDPHDRDDSVPFLESYDDDPLAADFARHLIALANQHDPPVTLRTRKSFALALCRMLAFLYGEDVTDHPDAPTLRKLSMRGAERLFKGLPTTAHDPEREALQRLDRTRLEVRVEPIRDARRVYPCRDCTRPASWSIATSPMCALAVHVCDEHHQAGSRHVQDYADEHNSRLPNHHDPSASIRDLFRDL